MSKTPLECILGGCPHKMWVHEIITQSGTFNQSSQRNFLYLFLYCALDSQSMTDTLITYNQ